MLSATDPNAGDSLSYALTDDAGGRFTLVDTSLQVANASALVSGTMYDATVKVTDNGGLALTRTFELQVDGVAPVADPYDTWISSNGVSNAALLADNDGDGVNNLVEYALGGNPTSNDVVSILPTALFVTTEGTNWFTYIYTRRTDAAAQDLNYTVLDTDNLLSNTWTNSAEELSAVALADGFEIVSNRGSTTAPQRMIKLKIQKD